MISQTPILLKIHFLFLLTIFISACKDGDKKSGSGKVHIEKVDGRYTVCRNGKPFQIKSASGDSHFKTLSDCGGNTIRTWDTTHLGTILDSAARNHLTVIAGLPVVNNNDHTFYPNPAKVKSQHQAFTAIVNKYKSHPALLMWCVGNELDFPYGLSYQSFYQAFNALTGMIHSDDPDHPVTTTVLNFNSKYILNLVLRCDVDFISFNIFSRLPQLRQELKDILWIWNGPYMLLEWGINGPWKGTEQTEWGSYIEDTSKKKAEIYKERYEKDMPFDDPRFLGASVFFWGNKQETTHTWFSIFDETGAASETVGTMQWLWTGKKTNEKYPDIKYMLLNEKGARDNIMLDASAIASAEVLMFSHSEKIKTISWNIYREDWYRKNNENSTQKLKPLKNLIQFENSLKVSFTAPSEEGPYRLFATIYDENGHFASCNTPFYVISAK